MRHGWIGLALLACAASAAAAERVVTLAPHLAELVCAVDACERLVGVVAYTDAPAAAAALPQVGDAFNVNLEAVLALQPDLILAWDAGTPASRIQRLKSLGLRVEVIAVRGLDDIADALERVGTLVGAADAGRDSAERYRRRLGALRQRYADRATLRAFYFTQTDPPFSVNRRSPIDEALRLCGADNVFADMPAIAGAVSLEAIVAARPEVAIYSLQEDSAAVAKLWRRLPALTISDSARQVRVDANTLTRQSPRVLDGIDALCRGLDRVRVLSAADD